jgi:hypothetical protein
MAESPAWPVDCLGTIGLFEAETPETSTLYRDSSGEKVEISLQYTGSIH